MYVLVSKFFGQLSFENTMHSRILYGYFCLPNDMNFSSSLLQYLKHKNIGFRFFFDKTYKVLRGQQNDIK